MKEKRIFALIFIICSIIAIISILIICINSKLFFSEVIYQLLLVIILLNIFLARLYLCRLLVEIRYDIDETKGKEKNVRDCYLYHQLLNPPEVNN